MIIIITTKRKRKQRKKGNTMYLNAGQRIIPSASLFERKWFKQCLPTSSQGKQGHTKGLTKTNSIDEVNYHNVILSIRDSQSWRNRDSQWWGTREFVELPSKMAFTPFAHCEHDKEAPSRRAYASSQAASTLQSSTVLPACTGMAVDIDSAHCAVDLCVHGRKPESAASASRVSIAVTVRCAGNLLHHCVFCGNRCALHRGGQVLHRDDG